MAIPRAQVAHNIDVDQTEDAIKASPGTLYGFWCSNVSAGVRYVKLYDATVATVEVGTTVPKLTIGVAAGAVVNAEFTRGIPFYTAITVAATTGVADNDTGAPGANDVIFEALYE